jgi:hypothetical protein
VLKHYGLDQLAVPRLRFYPLDYSEAYKFIVPDFYEEITNRIEPSTFVHFWNYLYRYFGFDISKSRPLVGSWLDAQYKDYAIYDRYDLQRVDERELRNKINAYVQEDSVQKRATMLGFKASSC